MISVVIGNGESRSLVNLKELKEHATLIGCNAIHRDFDVDHLVCCDARMMREVIANANCQTPNIYTRQRHWHDYRKLQKNKRVKLVPEITYPAEIKADEAEHWGSGPYAVLLAAQQFDTVCLIGFDLYGNDYLLNNIYKDTTNYLSKTANAVDPSYWIHQLKRIFQYHPNTKFKIFNVEGWVCPPTWCQSNVEVMDIKCLDTVVNTLSTVYNIHYADLGIHPAI